MKIDAYERCDNRSGVDFKDMDKTMFSDDSTDEVTK